MCLFCALGDQAPEAPRVIARDDACTLYLTPYPRAWGHLVLFPHAHITSFTDLDPALHLRLARWSHRAARAVEAALKPARCYVLSLGTARDDLPMSSPHLHWHIVPVMDADARPSDLFGRALPLWAGDAEEWRALSDRLCVAWATRPEPHP